MDSIVAMIVLGIVQGITEWLPISSKTQLMIFYLYLFNGSPDNLLSVLLVSHAGTLASCIFFLREEIRKITYDLLHTIKKPEVVFSPSIFSFLFFALIGTAITSVPFLYIYHTFGIQNDVRILTYLMGFGLILTSIFLSIKSSEKIVSDPTPLDGFITGLFQGLSVLPGVSRSGSTLAALSFRSYAPAQSFRLSFLLSIPTVFLAELLFYASPITLSFLEALILFSTSFFMSILALKTLLDIASRLDLRYFCIILGFVLIVLAYVQQT